MSEEFGKDEILAILGKVLDKWKKVKVRRFIVDKEVEFSPVYIAVNLQSIESFSIISENGGLINDPDEPARTVNHGFCATVGIGDFDHLKANGLGIGHFTDSTSLKPSALKRNVSKAINGAFQMALREYFSHHAEISEFKKELEFHKLSKEDPINYHEEEKKISIDLKNAAIIIEETDCLLSRNKKIKESEIELSETKENRWFVSYERGADSTEKKSNIFDSNVSGYVRCAITLKDANGKDIKFYRTIKVADGFDCRKEMQDLRESMEIYTEKFHKAPELESGLYRAVLSPDAAYTIFHEGFGAHLSSQREIDEQGATAFKAKLGQKILPECVTIIDDPTDQKQYGSYKFDCEGQPGKKVVLVESGILKNYLLDRVSAGRHKTQTNGHARSQFGQVPEPRAANMIVTSPSPAARERLIEMMIDGLKRHNEPFGLLINGRSGEVEIDSGQFKIFPSEFYKVYQDGIVSPVSSAYVVGDAYMTLNQVKAVGDDLAECVGFCGAESGLVRIGGLCPSVYFRKIEIRSSAQDAEADSYIDEEEE